MDVDLTIADVVKPFRAEAALELLSLVAARQIRFGCCRNYLVE
jgi:hypothetical protein